MEIDFSDRLNLEFSLTDAANLSTDFSMPSLLHEFGSMSEINTNLSHVDPLNVEFDAYGTATGIDVVKVNGVPLPVVNRTVDVPVPTKTSELINDSNYISDRNYVHTDNNFTDALKEELENKGYQVYRGSNYPADSILIWIETEEQPIVRNAMLTADGKYFITSDDLDFVPKEDEGYATLVTSDNNYFITSDDLSFMVAEVAGLPLYTSDNNQFIDAENNDFITKGES